MQQPPTHHQFLKNTVCVFDEQPQQHQTPSGKGRSCDPESDGTISLVLFRSTNRGAKDFGIYERGLRLWLTDLRPNLFPNYKLLLFIDEKTATIPSVDQILREHETKIRRATFKCPRFVSPESSDAHVDLFATMVRFFPMFSFPGSECLGRRAMLMDVEPHNDTVDQLSCMLALERAYDVAHPEAPLDILYDGKTQYDYVPRYGFASLRRSPELPYAIAQAFCVHKRVDPDVLVRFFDEHRWRRGMRWVYGDLNRAYDRGVDELFLNQIMLPAAQSTGSRIAYVDRFSISTGFYLFKKLLIAHRDSPALLSRILGSSRRKTADVTGMIRRIDDMFYRHRPDLAVHAAVAERYWDVISERVRDGSAWMPIPYMRYVLDRFRGRARAQDLVVYVGHKLERVFSPPSPAPFPCGQERV